MADKLDSPVGAMPPNPPDESIDADVKKWVKGLGQAKESSVISDEVFNENIQSHENSYTEILAAYQEDIKSTLKKKANYKPKVFWFSFLTLIGACGLVLFLTVTVIIKAIHTDNLLLWIVTITETLLSFLTTFMVIPQVITNYLFNTEEEKYMSEIIKNIQSYDQERFRTKNNLNQQYKDE